MELNRYTPVPPITAPVDEADSNEDTAQLLEEMEQWRQRMKKLTDENYDDGVRTKQCMRADFTEYERCTKLRKYERRGATEKARDREIRYYHNIRVENERLEMQGNRCRGGKGKSEKCKTSARVKVREKQLR